MNVNKNFWVSWTGKVSRWLLVSIRPVMSCKSSLKISAIYDNSSKRHAHRSLKTRWGRPTLAHQVRIKGTRFLCSSTIRIGRGWRAWLGEQLISGRILPRRGQEHSLTWSWANIRHQHQPQLKLESERKIIRIESSRPRFIGLSSRKRRRDQQVIIKFSHLNS